MPYLTTPYSTSAASKHPHRGSNFQASCKCSSCFWVSQRRGCGCPGESRVLQGTGTGTGFGYGVQGTSTCGCRSRSWYSTSVSACNLQYLWPMRWFLVRKLCYQQTPTYRYTQLGSSSPRTAVSDSRDTCKDETSKRRRESTRRSRWKDGKRVVC